MADFNLFLPKLLKHEGGYVHDHVDPGGATNKGITLRTFRDAARLFAGLEPTLDNLKLLTDEQAGIIYKQLYWDKLKADLIEPQQLAEIYADFYVNAGRPAVLLMQRVLNSFHKAPPLAVDGIAGPLLLNALIKADALEVYRCYRAGRVLYYRNLVAARPPLSKFLKGWINRVESFPEL